MISTFPDPATSLQVAAVKTDFVTVSDHESLTKEAHKLFLRLRGQKSTVRRHYNNLRQSLKFDKEKDDWRATLADRFFNIEIELFSRIETTSLKFDQSNDRTKYHFWNAILCEADRASQLEKVIFTGEAFQYAWRQPETEKLFADLMDKHFIFLKALRPYGRLLPEPAIMIPLLQRLLDELADVEQHTNSKPIAVDTDEEEEFLLRRRLEGVNEALRLVQDLKKDTRRVQDRHKAITKKTLALVAPGETTVPTWQKITAFAMGAAFLPILLFMALFVPNPTVWQLLVFRVILALAAGGIGALIPGFIEIKYRNWLRAGGATALFVIVYLVNPPDLITGPEPPSDTSGELEDDTEAGDT